MTIRGRELRSTVHHDRTLVLTLEDVSVAAPADDEVIIRIEASPINPSDLGILLGPADVGSLRAGGAAERPELTFDIPQAGMAQVKARLGQPLRVGNEGAGTVILAGRDAKALEGRRVAVLGGAMYADYFRIGAGEVVALSEGATSADGGSMFVNPLTALGLVETARSGGHKAIIHTAAASNLGQMLQKVCLADGVPLINVVRSTEQADILRAIGATHVVNTSAPDFTSQLVEMVAATGATVAFDAVGGGSLGSDLIQAMEQAACRQMTEYDLYGSPTFKQLYVYGVLDPNPITLNRMSFGFQWSVSGWLLPTFLRQSGPDVAVRLRQRVLNGLTTMFASAHSHTIGLAEALQPKILQSYERKATGEKYLIDPTRG